MRLTGKNREAERRLQRMEYKKEIIKIINSMAGKYSAYEVFTDWIRCFALSISNSCHVFHDSVWQEREKLYMDTIGKYRPNEIGRFMEMNAFLIEALEERTTDILGQIYMESGMGSKAAGQFFTPYNISLACAALTAHEPDENGIIRINEPSCGGGGMIIAVAETLKNKGINYQRCMDVVAQDLDWKGVYMCYVQLSMLGIKAICVQGDTLAEPYAAGYPRERILVTPAKAGALL